MSDSLRQPCEPGEVTVHPPGDGASSPAPPSFGASAHPAERPDRSRPPFVLLLRVRRAADGRVVDVAVGLDAGHRVDELAAALGRAVTGAADVAPSTLTSLRTGDRLPADAVVSELDVVSGDELLHGDADADPVVRARRPPPHALAVDVVAGPDSGRSQVLEPGWSIIGRRSGTDLTIDDPSVSREHAALLVAPVGVGEWSASIRPGGASANGVTVNDVGVHAITSLADGDVIGLGGTRLAVRRIERSGSEHADRLGQVDFHRTPYRPPRVRERSIPPIGPIPERPEPRRFHLFAILAPLAAGVIMYLLTEQVTFLALTLVSPLVMVASVVEDRRSGRRSFTNRLAAFRAALAETRSELERMRHDERLDRLRAHPDLADLVRRAELHTVDLWARGRSAPDFLALRLGLGEASVGHRIELERGGAEDLRDEARQAVAGLDRLAHVPVAVDLCTDWMLGIHGTPGLVDGVATSLLVQAATLHSPEDLTIVAAVEPERPLGWLKWLPHLRSVTSPMSGDHLVTDRSAADALVLRLVEIASFRTAEQARREPRRRWPRLLVVLDDELDPDPVQTSRLLDLAPDAGMSVLWLARRVAGVPRQASRILDVRLAPGATMLGRLWSTDADVAERTLEVEHLRLRLADRAARALAPVRDASTASASTSIPRHAPLLDVLGVGRPSVDWVVANWQRRRSYDLRVPLGIGADGPIRLDLVADGPHMLIGGTSGAGKSELLQSLVAGLAANHPPTRLNFLFIDYKGGASSQVFERLPHTVGHVTNLSADLALRALTSLRAELDRRMALLEGRAKNLAELLERSPDGAPASLVIVVDEFATLVKEVPDFVTGIVDIAQRGRSLGIHLVLATQRPSGSINENILANTNLRISLRMLDRAESSAVIDAPDAADIPVPLRGRAFVRLGPQRLVEFQSAFAGAPLVTTARRRPIAVMPFDRTDASPTAAARPDAPAPVDVGAPVTQLDAVIDAVVDADASLGLPAPRRPWREILPEVVTLESVLAAQLVDGRAGRSDRPSTGAGRFVTVGLLDVPEAQAQHAAEIDLEEGGGLLVFGAGGSGKTTLLRTVAASITAQATVDVAVVAFDFASRGLAGLRSLPAVVDVAVGDDLEVVTRHLLVLDAELERRRRRLADAGSEHFSAFERDHAAAAAELARIVVLIDGFGGLRSALLESSGSVGLASAEEWAERVRRVVIDGRAVGIHTVITADRRNSVPTRIHAAISNRLVLRHADEGSYVEHGLTPERTGQLDRCPGRGLLNGTTLVQIAAISADASARGQSSALAAAAPAPPHETTGAVRRLRCAALPERIDAVDATAPGPRRCTLGVSDVAGAPVTVDLEWSDLVVCGPARSGRSTALATAIRGLADRHPLTVIGPAGSPLAPWIERGAAADGEWAFGRGDLLRPVLDRLLDHVDAAGSDASRLLVIDDVDALDDPMLSAVWERVAGLDQLRVVMSLEQRSMSGYTTSALVATARRTRRLLVLQPDDPAEFLQTTGVKLPLRPGLRMVPGRGVLLVDRVPTVVQVVDALAPPVHRRRRRRAAPTVR